MITAWLGQSVAPGSWILDPIGSNPAVSLELAAAGYKVLISSNNPLLTFNLETLASKPERDELVKVVSLLANSRRADQSLEDYIQSFYLTVCPECGTKSPAVAYMWQRGDRQPESVRYSCPQCKSEGEKPFSTEDELRFKSLPSDELNRSRARSRVFESLTQREEPIVEEVLQAYPPRPLHILTTLLNRAEGLSGLTVRQKQLLTALLISLCDDAVGYWPASSPNHRPKQLALPAEYLEKNLWYALEANLDEWVLAGRSIEVTRWPTLPTSESGICLFNGRLKDLLPLPAGLEVKAIVSAVPRPNQAFWVLSAIWTGWLWGRSAVDPIRVSLDRQRYDWFWLAQALRANLARLQTHIAPDTPFFAIGSELTPGIATSHFAAPQSAGFTLEQFSYEPELELMQLKWTTGPKSPVTENPSEKLLHDLTTQTIQEINEPLEYIHLFIGLLHKLVSANAFPIPPDAIDSGLLTSIQDPLRAVLTQSREFVQFAAKGSAEEAGKWYLTTPPLDAFSLSDRVERFVVETLVKKRKIIPSDLLIQTCIAFPGLLTPPASLVSEIINSYTSPSDTEPSKITLRAEDEPAARKEDLALFSRLVTQIGNSMGYSMDGSYPFYWLDQSGSPFYAFQPIVTAMLGKAITRLASDAKLPPSRRIIALPGGRSNLAEFKINRNPALKAALMTGIRLLKFRALRHIAESPEVTLESFLTQLDGDPVKWEAPTQFTLFKQQ